MPSTAQHSDQGPDNKDDVVEQFDNVDNPEEKNLCYEENEEPALHARTYFALAAMFFLNLVQVFGLLGPPAALPYIEKDLNNTIAGSWVPNSLSLVQAVLSPLLSSLSDTFQARKAFLVGPAIISFIGSAIAPGSTNIYRLIAAQVLIGFGFATVPLAYCVPSDILPRRWRAMAQACINIAGSVGACAGPLIIGSLTRANPHTGWRNYYWIQMALWGVTAIGLFVGYRPPKRHTRLDHLSFWQKLGRVDLLGFFLLTAGLTIFLTGLNLGGGLYTWSSGPVLATLIVGILTLVAFGIYEWKFTRTGILHHDLFHGGKVGNSAGHTFAICIVLIFIEAIMLFPFVIFYPVLTTILFETDPFLMAVRQLPYWIAAAMSTVIYGYYSVKFKTIRAPMLVGFIIFTSGLVGMSTIQPDNNSSAIVFLALSGLGFGAPLILVIAGVQLSTPHHLIATATAATACSRAIAASVFTAIYYAASNARLENYIPQYISKAALQAGLPQSSVNAFVEALSSNDDASLKNISGITSEIISSGVSALRQAYADGLRVVFIIAVPFGVIACVASLYLGDLKKAMNYGVDAPIENLHAKRRAQT
ncbi:uncharacterized protein N7482_000990 [Penicillium canariense]|uniref:Major facilitator superfamily (MFS) profile domain-containing protein n=1 Tax=Penicillium canariense TaxID=189055 RepID=A0A9W9LSH8_9EURO|nr:uncharacterized protein N7482_000990 [Penicillium canariense]KAJ5175113.1 hypothetical protein N7482_000990 [Penicillium canariense]